ncbi:MAG: exodeoxyribonuclease VII small subunit [Clostridia bacterium]|nr:exodeoxyribonuclease VII small subunit [Clostridia bacterium]
MENNFEKSLIELENIIKNLENDEVSLEESIALFEKGIKLSNECRKTLETAENKIITLTDAEGEIVND